MPLHSVSASVFMVLNNEQHHSHCCSSATDGFQLYVPHADKQMYLFLARDMVVLLVNGMICSN